MALHLCPRLSCFSLTFESLHSLCARRRVRVIFTMVLQLLHEKVIMVHTLSVGDVMVKNVITVYADQTVRHAAREMSVKEIGCLVVLEKTRVVGIITEQDLIRRVIAVSKDPDETLVKDVMSTPPVVVEPGLAIEDAIKLMFIHKIKKLIVVQGEDKEKMLVGLITLTDIARIEPILIETLKALFEVNKEAPPRRMEKVMNYYIV